MSSSQYAGRSDPDSADSVARPWSVSELVKLGWAWNDTADQPESATVDEDRATRRRNAEFDTTSTQYPLPPVSL